jgi:eukaryotic-like serine/threonine-protein kinase
VIQLINDGELLVPEAELYPNVNYLIIEYAEKGDVRDALKENRATIEWKLRSLHQVTLGLRQLHSIFIAHQDIKPSNIVTMSNDVTKISDFGSAIPLTHNGSDLPPHLLKDFAGTWEYAPPELLYGYKDPDEVIRRIGCDLYLLGSIVAFYFTNMSMTSLIKLNLEDSFCWTNPNNYGQFEQIKAYLILAFEKALEDVSRQIDDDYIKEKIILIIRYLCNPDPKKRGHAKNLKVGSNYNLERFVSMFNEMATYYELPKGIVYKKRWE